MQYELMNKNTPLLLFACHQNEYGETEAWESAWRSEMRPLGYRTLLSFLERRRAPKHRKHIQQLLQKFGCEDLEGFLRVTHALSLNDTFWVREAGSMLTWEEVSLYRNPFNEVISLAAFAGDFSGDGFSSTSPEFGTDGQFAKCWTREGHDVFLSKCGSDLYEIEPLSEFLASQVANLICPASVEYDLSFYHGRLVSKCRLFTTEETGLVKMNELKQHIRTIPELLAYYEEVGNGDTFRRMCVLDSLILNVDRHSGNFGMLIDNDTQQILGAAPIFDHNRSLLFDLDTTQLEKPDWYIGQCRPRIGADFILTARGLMTDSIRNDLINMAGFSFRQHDAIRTNSLRLQRLSAVVNGQIRRILEAR